MYQPTPLTSYDWGYGPTQTLYTAASCGVSYGAQTVQCASHKWQITSDWYAPTSATVAVQFAHTYGTIDQSAYAQPQPDEETIAQWKREAEERHIKVQAAASRAEELLFMFIGEDRKKQYAEFGHFDVPVNGKVYRIRKGRSNNVLLLENGVPKVRYCAHPSDAVPDGDTMLAQFLMLTSDEKRFLGIANKSPCDGAYTPAAIPNIADPAGLGPEIVPDVMAYMEERAFAQLELAA